MSSSGETQLSNVVLSDKKPIKKVSAEVQGMAEALLEQFPHGFEYDNIMEATLVAMRYLAVNHRRLTGRQKKKMVVDALLTLLDQTDSGDFEKYEGILKGMIPTIVDNLVDVENGKIHINKKLPKLCLMCC